MNKIASTTTNCLKFNPHIKNGDFTPLSLKDPTWKEEFSPCLRRPTSTTPAAIKRINQVQMSDDWIGLEVAPLYLPILYLIGEVERMHAQVNEAAGSVLRK
ncbi:hypothetical protein GGD92_02335 [Pseudomonas protegens]|uniref:Uncharacterized protein n=1 Tax=Pseudomonas protegens TaxID=380021 RepID=A0A7G7XAZ4_9PSED|nr:MULTISPECIES: hypothetical protein [Pseudomonas]QNH77139.1 hypothetical protein GGI48_28470 [Pseudomonas protegens]QNL06334.1 hypothetical protein GGD92_02335 [Pseudomonas protegens]